MLICCEYILHMNVQHHTSLNYDIIVMFIQGNHFSMVPGIISMVPVSYRKQITTLGSLCVGSFSFHRHKKIKGLCEGSYGSSSFSKKSGESNHLQMSLQRQHFLLSYVVLNLRPPVQWLNAQITEPTGRWHWGF